MEGKNTSIKLKWSENLKTTGLQRKLSVINYIYINAIQSENYIISKIINFVQGMPFFRSLKEINRYIVYKLGGDFLHNMVLSNGKTEEFNKFLQQFELNYTFIPFKTMSGLPTIGAKFKNDLARMSVSSKRLTSSILKWAEIVG